MSALKNLLAGLLAFLFVVHAAAAQPAPSTSQPKNVILFITDGTGPATFTMARDFVRWKEGREALVMDSLLVGTVRTYSTSSRVTDSAAGATAYAAGVKTYNGAISVDPEKRPVATLLEAAEREGMATGLVATSRITHATPAAFASHVPDRGMENEIAAQMLTHDVEVLLGGGLRHFLPEDEGGIRTDGRNLLDEARAEGYQVVQARAELAEITEAPVLGLFAESHIPYAIDRDGQHVPSLAVMTRKALDLVKDDPDGFFLMVEASRIDHAAHANDAATHMREALAYEKAFAEALDFAREDGRTLIVATSDHETGGLSLGRDGNYAWHPEVLAEVEHSVGVMLETIADGAAPADVLHRLAGIDSLTTEEQALLEEAVEGETVGGAIKEIISERALVGWTTHGHTAVDVNVYAYGPGRTLFVGNHDNTYVGDALARLLNFDLPALTEALQEDVGTHETSSLVEHR